MGITLKTDINTLMGKIQHDVDDLINVASMAMKMACDNVVRDARLLDTYTDQTGNLRSSIGYVIYDNGAEIYQSFEARGMSTGGEEGVKKAMELASNVAIAYGEQLVAVVVAGMDYAVYVESKGLDVITGPWLQYRNYFDKYFNEALRSIKND